MMHSHLGTLVVFAALVSTVFAMLLRDTPRERLKFGLTAFAAFVLSTLVINEDFLAKAPADVVQCDQERHQALTEKLAKLKSHQKRLRGMVG